MVQGNERYLPYIADTLFPKYFGKTYDQLTADDLNNARLGQRECQRNRLLTAGEGQIVSMIWNTSMQPRLAQQLIAQRSQQSPVARTAPPPAPMPNRREMAPRQSTGIAAVAPLAAPSTLPPNQNEPAPVPQASDRPGLAQKTQLMNRCDKLAADPNDPLRTVPGVADTAILPDAAVTACADAAQAAPDSDRIRFQLGRALLAAKKPNEAVVAFQQAAKANYPAALAYLSTAYEYGAGGLPKDQAQADKLDKLATAGGYAAPANATAATGRVPDASAGGAASKPGAQSKQAAPKAGPKLAGDFEQPHLINAIYSGDTATLGTDRMFAIKYLITQATILKEECQSFKLSEIRGYEEKVARLIMQRSGNEAVKQGMNNLVGVLELMVKSRDNPQALVDVGVAEQRLEDAATYAAHDIVEFTRKHGVCGSTPLERYTRNLRSYFESGAFAR